MDSERGLLMWIAGFSGVLLIYAAYKNRSVVAIATDYFGSSATSGADLATGTSIPQVASPTGTQPSNYVFDSNGLAQSVPDAYARSPHTYIPA